MQHDRPCCDDCGDFVKRRTHCAECDSLTCRWCFHHNLHTRVRRIHPLAHSLGSPA